MAVVVTEETFDRMLREALEKHVTEAAEKEIAAAKERIEVALRESLASIAMGLIKHYDVQSGERQIIIKVRNEAKI